MEEKASACSGRNDDGSIGRRETDPDAESGSQGAQKGLGVGILWVLGLGDRVRAGGGKFREIGELGEWPRECFLGRREEHTYGRENGERCNGAQDGGLRGV